MGKTWKYLYPLNQLLVRNAVNETLPAKITFLITDDIVIWNITILVNQSFLSFLFFCFLNCHLKLWPVTSWDAFPYLARCGSQLQAHDPYAVDADRFNTYPAWLCQNSYWKWPFIVDFPMKNGGSFHSFFVNVYQRVTYLILRSTRSTPESARVIPHNHSITPVSQFQQPAWIVQIWSNLHKGKASTPHDKVPMCALCVNWRAILGDTLW